MDDRMIIFTPCNDRQTPEKQAISRRVFLKGIGIACLGFGMFLHACGYMPSERENMEKMKPPIDLAAPTKTETATFAMG
jgi:hypothetical protein